MTVGSHVIVVTGTDTGVGKTVATSALAVLARTRGRVAVYKPVQTGTSIGDGDAQEVRRWSGIDTADVGAELSEPLAPVTAARREQRQLPSLDAHVRTVQELAATHETVLVEGAGGVLVALTEAGEGVAEVAAALDADMVVVTRAGLGTLNHTALTTEALRSRGCRVRGLIVGSWPTQPDLAALCNIDDLPRVTGAKILGRIPEGIDSLPVTEFRDRAPEWIDTVGWWV
ncbi:MAG TPA: dethiobiotin synthase [Actinomycetes bacterium]|nr:dethiobiotin synthase [Actinomycetes bacterium]